MFSFAPMRNYFPGVTSHFFTLTASMVIEMRCECPCHVSVSMGLACHEIHGGTHPRLVPWMWESHFAPDRRGCGSAVLPPCVDHNAECYRHRDEARAGGGRVPPPAHAPPSSPAVCEARRCFRSGKHFWVTFGWFFSSTMVFSTQRHPPGRLAGGLPWHGGRCGAAGGGAGRGRRGGQGFPVESGAVGQATRGLRGSPTGW
jgi:hypothetical protein